MRVPYTDSNDTIFSKCMNDYNEKKKHNLVFFLNLEYKKILKITLNNRLSKDISFTIYNK